MVGGKYVWTSRLIQTSWILSSTVTETVYTSKTMNLIWKWHNTSRFWQNNFISWPTLTNSTIGALYWLKQLFIFNTNPSRMDVIFLMSIFWLYPGFKMFFEHNSVCKNFFLSACFCWDSWHFSREMDQKMKIGATIGCVDSYLEFFISSFRSI